jgi:hypothetical protein
MEKFTKQLESHHNQPHPPQQSDQRPFEHHESRAPQPTQPPVAFPEPMLKCIAQLFHSERACGAELHAEVLGFVSRSANAGIE